MNLTFKQYRAIDLTILSVVLAVCEFLTAKAATAWFPGQLYALSPTVTVVCIVMMRWNGYAAIHAALGGLIFCLTSGANEKQILIYCVGNCFGLAALTLFKVFGKKKIKDKFGFTVLFTLAAFVGTQLGRWLVGLLLGGSPDTIIVFLTTDSLSLLFAIVVVLISRKADGLFEDQKEYLVRMQAERKRKEAEDYYNG
ncbi:MAG: hypothetical protein NC203_03505 [Firmicutes bacterium]|nr:hypothetical protein [[Eubacterium] siraeum]MCM1487412.1 hypothetical protein [Bacillota bacterium]